MPNIEKHRDTEGSIFHIVRPVGLSEEGLLSLTDGGRWASLAGGGTIDAESRRKELYAEVLLGIATAPLLKDERKEAFLALERCVLRADENGELMDRHELAWFVYDAMVWRHLPPHWAEGSIASDLNLAQAHKREIRRIVEVSNWVMAGRSLRDIGKGKIPLGPTADLILFVALANDEARERLTLLEEALDSNDVWEPALGGGFGIAVERLAKDPGWWDSFARYLWDRRGTIDREGYGPIAETIMAQAAAASDPAASASGQVSRARWSVPALAGAAMDSTGWAEALQSAALTGAVAKRLKSEIGGSRSKKGYVEAVFRYSEYQYYHLVSQALEKSPSHIAARFFGEGDLAKLRQEYITEASARGSALTAAMAGLTRAANALKPGKLLEGVRATVKGGDISFRKEPGGAKDLAGNLRPGEEIEIVDRVDAKQAFEGAADFWYLVRAPEGLAGWLFGTRLDFRLSQDARARESTRNAGMVFVRSGQILMGSLYDDDLHRGNRPRPLVTISDFYIGRLEVTQDLYREVMGTDQYSFAGADLPAESVSWYECLAFCNKLSAREKLQPCYIVAGIADPDLWRSGDPVACDFSADGYRLPTEAEWEYAARGGPNAWIRRESGYPGSGNPEDLAWYSANSGDSTHPVGRKPPNLLGLYDMGGNVWEWCWDRYGEYLSGDSRDPAGPSSGIGRVIRGGAWSSGLVGMRWALRMGREPEDRFAYLGFRLVRRP